MKYKFLVTITEMDSPFWDFINVGTPIDKIKDVQDELIYAIGKGSLELDDNTIEFVEIINE